MNWMIKILKSIFPLKFFLIKYYVHKQYINMKKNDCQWNRYVYYTITE